MGLGASLGIGIGAGLLSWGTLLPTAVASGAVDAASAVATEATTAPMTVQMPEPTAVIEEVVEEIPEEILRTEIITEARSPLTGELLNAAEYAQLQAELAQSAGGNLVSEDLRHLIFLLQLRRALKPILPFIK